MDIQSILGYSMNSPFAGNPYLDINTPEGLIDMSNTPIDLVGIDNKGNKKVMKAGRKNPYRFEGDVVREIPMQQGGFSQRDVLSFLFQDDDDNSEPETKKEDEPTAPSTAQISPKDTEQEDLAMEQANLLMEDEGNPYRKPGDAGVGNPYRGSSLLSNYGEAYKDIDENVAMATQELITKFPNLKLTSGRRTWGDKDAHPKGRAVDLSYNKDAFEYYQNVLVPKYKFNKALDPDHGTGKHIHLGYY